VTSIVTCVVDKGGADVYVDVFAGPDRHHRVYVGYLVFPRGEEQEFIRRVEDEADPDWMADMAEPSA